MRRRRPDELGDGDHDREHGDHDRDDRGRADDDDRRDHQRIDERRRSRPHDEHRRSNDVLASDDLTFVETIVIDMQGTTDHPALEVRLTLP
jgi:hypothetical protein